MKHGDCRDKTDSGADESTLPSQDSERVDVPCDKNIHFDPNSPNEQNPTLSNTELYEKGNNAEDKEGLVKRNLNGSVMEDDKLSGYVKDLSNCITKEIENVMMGATWSNKSCSKLSSSDESDSSCSSSKVPIEGSPPAQDSSTKQDTPPTEDTPATQSGVGAQGDRPTQGIPTTPVSPAAQNSLATETQSSPATQGNTANLMNSSVDDEGDNVPSGEDGEISITNADIHVPSRRQDQDNNFQNSTSAGATDSNETAVAECGSNLKLMQAARTAKASQTPISGRECDCDCNRPSGQDEAKESKMSSQCDDCNIARRQGVANTLATEAGTTAGPCSVINSNPPTSAQSNTAETSAPAEAKSVDKGSGANSEDSATSLDTYKTNMTSTGSTVSLPTNGCASKGISCNTPCTDPPIDTELEICDVNTPGECHDESTDAYDGGSLTEQNPVAVIDLMVSSDNSIDIPLTTDTKSKDGPYECEAAETSNTVDAHTETKSNERSCTVGPDEIVMKPAYQSPSKASSASSDTLQRSWMISTPLFLYMLVNICFIQAASSQKEAANFTISNVTEILSMMWCGSESFPIDDQSEKLHIYWTIIIGVAVELLCIVYLSIFCQPVLLEMYTFIIAFFKKAYQNVCSFALCVLRVLFECIKHRSGQQVETPTSATSVNDDTLTSSAQHLVTPSEETTPTQATEHPSSSVEPLSYRLSEYSTTPNSRRLQQSVDSGYQTQTPIPGSRVALLSGNDRRVHGNGESLFPRSNLQSTSVQFSEMSSQTTEADTIDVSISPPTNSERPAYRDNSVVECTRAENCNPGELVSVGFHMTMFRTDMIRGGAQQEETQPSNRTSELAGVSYRHREQTIQVLPPRVLTLEIPQENVGPSPIQTVAVRIDPASQLLAFNATVEEAEHSAPPDPTEDVHVLDCTPIVLEHSLLDSERGLLLSTGLADAEVHMFQLQDLPYARAYPAQGGMADSVPVYPPLPSVPSANAELQPVWPPLPITPSTSTPMIIIPVAYVP